MIYDSPSVEAGSFSGPWLGVVVNAVRGHVVQDCQAVVGGGRCDHEVYREIRWWR